MTNNNSCEQHHDLEPLLTNNKSKSELLHEEYTIWLTIESIYLEEKGEYILNQDICVG